MERDRTDWKAELKRFGKQLLFIYAMFVLFVGLFGYFDSFTRDAEARVNIAAACGAALVALGAIAQVFVRAARDEYGHEEGRRLEKAAYAAIAAGGLVIAAAELSRIGA